VRGQVSRNLKLTSLVHVLHSLNNTPIFMHTTSHTFRTPCFGAWTFPPFDLHLHLLVLCLQSDLLKITALKPFVQLSYVFLISDNSPYTNFIDARSPSDNSPYTNFIDSRSPRKRWRLGFIDDLNKKSSSLI
jgi:hypothetical protein